MKSQIVVTGGAGYIGSHTTRQLVDRGYDVIVADNLCTGHRWAVPPAARFIDCDIGDEASLKAVFEGDRINAVAHFAAHTVVPESVGDPLKYYHNNCLAPQWVRLCRHYRVAHFLFSSSAAVYAEPASVPVSERAATRPINPYGLTKLVTEWLLQDVANSATADVPFRFVALRYFNVAGAALDGSLGQATPAATHLIKVAREVACGKRDSLQIFGDDYPTPDGTCVREIEDAVRAVSGQEVPAEIGGRRAGDPAQLIADNARITRLLKWAPRNDDLVTICRSACLWERKLTEIERKTA